MNNYDLTLQLGKTTSKRVTFLNIRQKHQLNVRQYI